MKSELLLPVGNMKMCLAAIHNGADAIYVGVPHFNARGRTTDFSIEELREMIQTCHLYGVRVNLAFNVVIFENELEEARDLLEQIIPLAPDAFIVQDLGLAKLIRQMSPTQRIHGSTQMTVTNHEAMKLLDDLKIDRFVLGRENSIPEIKLIRENTDKELEVFVHGALCVAYSGQCFTSESIGGRSANRGQCAQSCRLDYEMYVDNVKTDLGNKKYLVSPQDLCGIEEVPELKKIGVNSFKIEGRLKTPEYVAVTAKNYREVLDGAPVNYAHRSQDLAMTYSRGFFSGWLHGVNHQKLVEGTYSAHRGIEAGSIREFRTGKSIIIESKTEIKAGQGLLFAVTPEIGDKVFEAKKIAPSLYEVKLLHSENIQKLKTSVRVFINSDEKLDREIQKSFTDREKLKRIPLSMMVKGQVNDSLILKAIDDEGRELTLLTESKIQAAASRPITMEAMKEELGALGTSPFILKDFSAELIGDLFIHQKELKELRRKMVEEMSALRLKRDEKPIYKVETKKAFELKPTDKAQLNLLLRSKKQVDALAKALVEKTLLPEGIGPVVLDFEFGKDFAPSVKALKEVGLRVGIATTRILKPKEYYNFKIIQVAAPDFVLARNLGAVQYFTTETKLPVKADFSLNITNSWSADYLLSKGVESLNASYDLNQNQLLALAAHMDASKLEVTLHQYMPEFHMEHCVFAAFMSKGTSFKDCGKPCEKHEVKLKDPYGNWHHLKPDQECRNTFFRATPQSASFLVDELKKIGVREYRLEALNESEEQLLLKVKAYQKLILGQSTSEEVMKQIGVMESYGLSSGQLSVTKSYKDRKKSEIHS